MVFLKSKIFEQLFKKLANYFTIIIDTFMSLINHIFFSQISTEFTTMTTIIKSIRKIVLPMLLMMPK